MFFNRKKAANVAQEDRELIAQNAKSVDALVVLAQGNTELVGKLQEMQEMLKYLMGSTEPKIMDFDKKIQSRLGDLRIALTKSDGETTKGVEEIFTDIKLIVADRNAKM